jgi:hypothetical protein
MALILSNIITSLVAESRQFIIQNGNPFSIPFRANINVDALSLK